MIKTCITLASRKIVNRKSVLNSSGFCNAEEMPWYIECVANYSLVWSDDNLFSPTNQIWITQIEKNNLFDWKYLFYDFLFLLFFQEALSAKKEKKRKLKKKKKFSFTMQKKCHDAFVKDLIID